MKTLQKLFIVFFMVFCFTVPLISYAQSYRLKAYELSYKTEDRWGGWSDWSTWESCNINISFNLNTQRILIFSKETQDYSISEFLPSQTDNNGESQVMRCVDGNGLICTVRLRTQYRPRGLQLYIEYRDMVWVYNVQAY